MLNRVLKVGNRLMFMSVTSIEFEYPFFWLYYLFCVNGLSFEDRRMTYQHRYLFIYVFLFLPKQPPLINILVMVHIMCSTLIIISLLLMISLLQKTEALITQEDGTKKWKNNCWQVREDYFECLHSKKEWAMVRRVAEEEKRQAAVAAGGQ